MSARFQSSLSFALPVGALLAGLCLGVEACSPVGTAVGVAAKAGVTAAQERGFQTGLNDHRIWLELNHLLLQESELLFRRLNLQVHEGRVLMSGNVPAPEARITAVRLAWQVPTVREVINEIEISDRASLTNFGRDQLISTELEAKLLLDRSITSINYSIETQNQVIFLIGIARDRPELERVVAHAKDIAYVRRVVNYVVLRDDPERPA